MLRPLTIASACLLAAASTASSAQVTDLMRTYTLALTNDPTFQAAGATNRAAQEATPQARALLLPSVSADVSAFGNDAKNYRGSFGVPGGTTSRFNDQEYGVQLSQPLYRRDRWIALDQAKTSVDQADARFAFEQQALILRVAERYFGVLSAADTLTFTIAAQEAFGQQLEQAQQRFEVGLIAITDVEEAKAGFDLARADVISAETALNNAREALREVTGEYHDAIATLGDKMPLEMPEPDDVDRWTETSLEQNLQLLSQRHASNVARMEIQRAESGHVPTLDLVAGYRRATSNGGVTVGGAAGSDTSNASIGVQLVVPIYQGGLVVSRTRESRSLYQQSLDDLERVRRSVQRQTRDAFLGVRSGISRVIALAQAVRSNEAAAEAIEAGFQVGTRTTVDVLDAQRDLNRARRDYSVARYDYILDILTLKQAAGVLTEEDLRQINSWLQ